MSDLFQEMIESGISNGVPVVEKEDLSFIEEAVFLDDLPSMVTMTRKFNLPKGDPYGKGNLCFMYSKSVDATIHKIKNGSNAIFGNRFYWYYITPIYRGKIFTKPYKVRLSTERVEIYNKLKALPFLHPYRPLQIAAGESRSMVFELAKYLEIFDTHLPKQFKMPMKYTNIYWPYFKNIIAYTNALTGYSYRFVLINLNEFPFDKPILKNMENPIALMYYTLYRNPAILKDLDIDFIYYTDKKVLKFNPAKSGLNKETAMQFKSQMRKLIATAHFDNFMQEDEITKDEAVEKTLENIVTIIPPTGTATSHEITKKLAEKVTKVKEEIKTIDTSETTSKELEGYVKTRVESEIDNDEELLKALYKETEQHNMPSPPILSARDQKIKEAQQEIEMKGIKIKDIEKVQATHLPIEEKKLTNALQTTNEGMKDIKFQNFDKTYNEKVMPKDIANAFMCLNNKSIPMFMLSMKATDTSDELNYKETYTVVYEDVNRTRHTVTVDLPKFIENSFLYLGGNKKLIKKQNTFFPVVKTDTDEVQIVSNYNKMFIHRVDTKSISSVARLRLFLKKSDEIKKFCKFNNVFPNNTKFVTTLEYDELSKLIEYFKSETCQIYFNQVEAQNYSKEHRITIPSNMLFIGMENNKPIFVNTETQVTVGGAETIMEVMIRNLPADLQTAYTAIQAPKSLMYVMVTVMKQHIGLIELLCFWEGLTNVLKKMNVKYTLSLKAPKKLEPNQGYVRFKNCYLIYDETVGQALLLNGLRLIPTAEYTIAEMDTQEPYIRYFSKKYGRASIGNALLNFYEFMLDPITIEILEDIHLPTDIVSLSIYAVNLLQDSQHKLEVDQSLSRVRSNEIVPAILYSTLADGYLTYRNSNGRKKFSVKKDGVINTLMGIKTVEDYSTLNPFLELDSLHGISAKGYHGSNLAEAYKVDKRAYDSSMIGIIAPSSPPDGNVGVNRELSTEPNIVSARGYVDISYKDKTSDLSKLKDVNLFSPVELAMPLAATIDDPTRLGHAVKQSRHTIPVKDSSPVLISNGIEEMARFKLSSDFVVNADEDGSVIDYDDESKVMIVKYKSGKNRAIDLDDFIVKNGGGGFFLANTLITDLKVGDKFKKDDVLAYHKNFFTNDKFNNARMNLGTLAKVALMSSADTYEDATFISHRLSDAATTEMCFMTQCVIGKNSNITYMCKKGDKVSVSDPLIQFDTSFEDSELNELLAAIGDDDLKKQITEEAKNTIRSKYSGVIEAIEIYSTVDTSMLSPSLKKIVSAYYKKISNKREFLEKYDPESKDSVMKCGILCKEPNHKINPNKFGVIKGQKVEDSILINFYIKHEEKLEVGSKIANFSALKNTIATIIPEGYEPYSESRPDEIIDTIIAANSILQRKTPSIALTALGNKCLIELKRSLEKIYNE